ncbi:Metallo-beta-lactamase L1 precursor [Actinomadura rubteroloni]|uniref:Metallo-beta-lactamase L1 n=1 Tax=Actinomadura rubteroloni TaxID=1926885 RepID=A0A2P4UQJ8_9ACTN|nr:MBL fold metallo-hydrolase [Actinomadura rubteroloni]POM27316.1 Metallo-beta-lactamase L1 precursor [Actinomadura rubteroloni]
MSYDPPVQAAENVFLGTGTDVNWVLLRDGRDLTLIDGGYPGDLAAVVASIRAVGHRPEDVRAILVTHAHVDHLGAVNPFHARFGTPVHLAAAEVPHARREYLQQLTPGKLLAQLHRPGVLPWALRILRAGATRDVAAPHALPFATAGALDLPGAPVPVPTPGHTSGHTAYFIPSAGAVATGDSLITGHAVSRRRGPQLIAPWFNHGDDGEIVAALAALERLDADTVLPGHGPVHHGSLQAAIADLRA